MNYHELFEKFTTGIATEADREAFSNWLETLSPAESEKVLQEYEQIISSLPFYPDYGQPSTALLLQRMQAAEANREVKAGRGRIRRIFTVAAAAVVAGALAIGIYLFREASRPVALPVSRQSIAPGGNKAILTLGDGQQLTLDSATNGTLAEQGGTKVVKLADGQLAYQPSDHPPAGVLYNTVSTPRGGEYQLLLPDGTRVWLNAASSIRYPTVFQEGQRSVEVTGETYFEVAKDHSRPFLVSAGGIQVEVLGTAFNLMAYADEDAIRTTVADGSVRVMKGKNARIVTPGQQASLAAGNENFSLSEPDLDEVLAWKEGRFRFRKVGITTIMRQLARWYDVDIDYKGDIPSSEFDGSLSRKENPYPILKAFERTRKVHFSIEGKKITVMPGTGPASGSDPVHNR